MKQTKRLTRCAVAVASAIGMMLLCGGCATTEMTALPPIDFPIFPAPSVGDVLFDEDTGRVNMSLDYFERIYEYKVRVEGAQKVYEKTKALMEGKGDEE